MTAGPQTVGLVGVGRMGAAVARALLRGGHNVLIFVGGRSETTLARARDTGATVVADLGDLVSAADVLLSIVPSRHAVGAARQVARALGERDRPLVFVEANPISRQALADIEAVLAAKGARLVDAGIVGLPPDGNRRPILVVSGASAMDVAFLDGVAFDVMDAGGRIGDASLIKLLQCGLSKGVNASLALLYAAAERGRVLEPFLALVARSQPDLAARAERSIPWIAADADRWPGEIDELARQFDQMRLPTGFALGTLDVLAAFARSPIGSETRESRDAARTMPDTIRVVAASMGRDGRPVPSAGDSFVLTLMTDDLEEALRGVAAGVDRIGPDLEQIGKAERQNNIGTRVSIHDPEFLGVFREHAGRAKVFCRTDPIHEGSQEQIDRLIGMGAKTLMLPYFHTAGEVERFVRLVDGRATTTILCETAASLFRMDELLEVDGVDEIQIGLTDLMLSSRVGSRYELLVSGSLDAICALVHAAGKPLHLAGVARLDDDHLPVPSDLTLARYAELGVSGSLLTRAFLRGCTSAESLSDAVSALRSRIDHWARADAAERASATADLRARARAARASGRPLP
jgi:3-hydroxyisobutyrate dehydrogenase-like beta-hydroxyacid dehydrogenase